MIERIYADNYKCLVNFDFTPRRTELWLGRNGAGKSCVFEVAERLVRFVHYGATASAAFPRDSRTRWLQQPAQTFEVTIRGNDGTYRYRLELDELPGRKDVRVRLETLTFEGAPLLRFDEGEIQLFRDDGSAGPAFRLDWLRSGLAAIAPERDNQRLTWFKDRISRIRCIQINPWEMVSETDEADDEPIRSLGNFASWYRRLRDERPVEAVTELFASLREVIDEFDSLRYAKVGEARLSLVATFTHMPALEDVQKLGFRLDELSHGQRCLIGLYALTHCAMEPNSTLVIDEPDNYVALSEIEPWLQLVDEVGSRTGAQVLIISHHPEIINRLAGDCGVLFFREGSAATRVRPFQAPQDSPLLPAELVARGWELDE